MKKTHSKFLSVLLILSMALALLPATVLAADSDFTIVDGVLTKYNGPGGDVVIPNGVTNIGDYAFYGCNGLTSVTIPSSVASIGEWAFGFCSGLTGVTIPSSVTSIGVRAFSSCSSLTSVTIPGSVISVGGFAFADTPWLKNQGDFAVVNGILLAYQGSGDSVAIPSSVTSIGDDAFNGTPWLENQGDYAIVNGILLAYQGSSDSVAIPGSVTSIGAKALSFCYGLSSVAIPSSVTSIGAEAFSYCHGLSSVTIPSSVTSIGAKAFGDCESLTDVYYGGSEEQWKALKRDDDGLEEATIHYNSAIPEAPVTPAKPAVAQAMPTNDRLTCNGAAQNPTVYKINDSNYFKIRDLAAILNGTGKQFAVDYDKELQSVTATTGKAYTMTDTDLKGAPAGQEQAEISNDTIYIDGKKVDVAVYKIDGSNYFKLRDLGKALNFYVGWTKEQGMFIETDKPYSDSE